MQKVASVIAVLGMAAALCVGCGKTDKPVAEEAAPKTEAVTQTKESSTKQWEPETATPPKAHNPQDGGDHSGHNH